MTRLRCRAFALALASAAGPAAAGTQAPAQLAPLACPPETQFYKLELKKHGVLYEGCRDAAGKRQGPHRYIRQSDGWLIGQGRTLDGQMHGEVRHYAENGELLYTTDY